MPTRTRPTWPARSAATACSTPRAPRRRSMPLPPPCRSGPSPPRSSARTCSTSSAARSWRARPSWGGCWRWKRARPWPRASVRPPAPGRSSSSSPARRCASPAKSWPRPAPASTWRSPANPWVRSASSRRGISRWRSRPGRSPRRWPTATRWCSSRPRSCRAAPGRSPKSCRAPGCPTACSTWSSAAAGWSARRWWNIRAWTR